MDSVNKFREYNIVGDPANRNKQPRKIVVRKLVKIISILAIVGLAVFFLFKL